MPDLSIIFGTYNRLEMLRECLESLPLASAGLATEIIIVDGGSTDGSLELLRQQDVVLIEHGELRGAVAAYNDGFSRAAGELVAYLNDDLILAPNTLFAACCLLVSDPQIGIVSIPYRNPGDMAPVHPITQIHGASYPFASFGVLRRELGEQASWFDGFSHYYGDCYLCVTIQQMGYRLIQLGDSYTANHRNADNALRGEHRWPGEKYRVKEDGIRWQAMWEVEHG